MTDVSENTYDIPPLVLGDTFYEWMQVTNNSIIEKLNRMDAYTLTAGDGIDVTNALSGEQTIEIASIIPNAITFSENVTFNGTVTKINSTELTIDDYNIVLGAINSDVGGADALIDSAGGGGIILTRSAGPDASLLWKGLTAGGDALSDFGIGCSGEWKSTDYLSLTGGVGFKSGDDKFIFKTSGDGADASNNALGPGFQITVATGPAGHQTYAMSSMRLGHHATAGTGGAGLTYGVQFDEDGMVRIYDGVNKKLFTHDSTLASGFTFGAAVRLLDGGTCDLANADTKEEAEVFGVISEVLNSTQYVVTMTGEIKGDFSSALGVAGPLGATLESGTVYFLDTTITGNSGEITATEIVTAGKIRKPMIIGMGETAGYVVQYVGARIAADTDEVAPVMRRINILPDGTNESVGSQGLTCDFPSGDVEGDGKYSITHNFGTADYTISATTRGSTCTNAFIIDADINGCTIGVVNADGSAFCAPGDALEVILAKQITY